MKERRQHKRHSFSATAELVDLASGTRLSARVGDLNEAGCYLDLLSPLPIGSNIRIRIRSNGAEFTGTAEVRDSQSGMGMGVAFTDLDDARRAVIDGWIGKQSSAALPDFSPSSASADAKPAPVPSKEDALAVRLVELLHKKGVLSSSEVDTLLRRWTL